MDEEIVLMGEELAKFGRPLQAVVHSLAFANREDLSRPLSRLSAKVSCWLRTSAPTR